MIELLRKSGIALLVLALALIAQIPHAAYVFDRAPYIGQAVQPDSAWYALLLAYAYAIALESATLMFVVHGRQRASYGFALASFAVNLSYYSMHKVTLFSLPAIPVWLLSALIPTAIASYSHILAGAQDTGVQVPTWALRAWAKLFAQDAAVLHEEPDGVFIEYAEPVQDDAQPIDAKVRALQLHSEGIAPAEIARILQGKESTVRSWIRRSNGALKVAV